MLYIPDGTLIMRMLKNLCIIDKKTLAFAMCLLYNSTVAHFECANAGLMREVAG
jgi:hypothetical protein